MALIICPECQKEISDTASQCIHCGYQRVPSVPATRGPGMRRMLVISISILLMVGGIWAAWNQYQSYVYRREVHAMMQVMLSDMAVAERQANLVMEVWHDAIFQDYRSATEKYVYMQGVGYVDFDTALLQLRMDPEVLAQQYTIRTSKDAIQQRLQALNVPSAYQDAHQEVVQLHVLYQKMIELAYTPSGSYNSYSTQVPETASTIVDLVRQITINIPAVDA